MYPNKSVSCKGLQQNMDPGTKYKLLRIIFTPKWSPWKENVTM